MLVHDCDPQSAHGLILFFPRKSFTGCVFFSLKILEVLDKISFSSEY